MDKAQRDYVLRQQMRAIQKELGEDETGEAAETEMLRERLEKAELPEEVRAEADRELKRLQRLPPRHLTITSFARILSLFWNCRG
jgi:ATP-dependent Lon protease